MRIFLPNVLSYQIPCIQLPEFGSAFLAEFAQNVFGMCLPMDWIMIPLFGKSKKWDLNQFTNSWDKIVNFTKFLVPTYQSLLYDTCNSCVADIFKTNKNLSQELFMCSFFGLKSDKLNCFQFIFILSFEEVKELQVQGLDLEEFVPWWTVLKKVSWFFNFCQHVFI